MEETLIEQADGAPEHSHRHIGVPMLFLGVGFYRAWIEVTYTNPPMEIPAVAAIGNNLQDVLLGFCLLACALLAWRLHPLHAKRAVVWAATFAMCASTVLEYWSVYRPDLALPLAIPATVLSTVGLSIIILIWCELYSCLNPLRVALYYSGGLILGWVICYFLNGLSLDRLLNAATLLPLLSTYCAFECSAGFNPLDLPHPPAKTGALPWKILIAVAVYTFAFGLFESSASIYTGPLSSWGMAVGAIVVFALATFFADRLRVEGLFRIALPLMILGLLLTAQFTQVFGEFSHFLIDFSYAIFLIFIMVIMCDYSRRSGVSAIWLFGIERFIRFIVYAGGLNIERLLGSSATQPSVVHIVLVIASVALIAFVTVLLLADGNLLAKRVIGANLNDAAADPRAARMDRIEALATAHNLTSREKEVFDLLLEDKSIAEIERELYISNGTVRAHIQHIYRKCGIHSRQELVELVDE